MDFRERLIDQLPALRAFARGLLRDREEADDLVQECLARAIEKNHLWKRGTNLKAWLFTILHNLFVNRYRVRKNRPETLPLDDHSSRFSMAPDQPAAVELREVEAALHRLSADQREVVILIGMQGLSYDEVAVIMDVPLGTVRSRLSRARRALKELLGDKADAAMKNDSSETAVAAPRLAEK